MSSPVASAARTPDRAVWARVLADVAVVTVTPFRGEGAREIDHDGLTGNLGHLLDSGVGLLVAGGNTGEFAALAPSEVVEVVRVHARVASGRAHVVAGIGYRLDEAIELGVGCVEAGADALMVHHPIHPYASEPGLLDYYEAIGRALPGVPLVLYIRGPQLSPDGVRRLAAIQSIVGVKVGLPDPTLFGALASAAPDLAWVCGLAETWALPFWHAGAVGFTSGLANVLPGRSLEVLAALRAGDADRAERLVDMLRPFETLRAARADAANVAVIKAALDLAGLTGGRLRPPLSSLEPTEQAALAAILRDLGELP